MPRKILILGLLSALSLSLGVGCRTGDMKVIDPVDGKADEFAALTVDCPDAPVLGVEGSSTSERFVIDLPWRDDEGWSRSEAMVFRVPPDLSGLSVTVSKPGADVGVGYVANNGTVVFDMGEDDPDLEGAEPFFHTPARAGTLAFPVFRDGGIAAGCLSLAAVGLDDASVGEASLHIASKRGEGATMNVNVIVVGDTVVNEERVSESLDIVSEIFSNTGAGAIGEVSFETLDWPDAYLDGDADEDTYLLSASYNGGDPKALNLYFVQDYLEEGNAGAAAGIPGPIMVQETEGSGVVMSVDTHLDADTLEIDPIYMAETIAHEIGHQLGLFHVTEAGGDSFDGLDDTAECSNDADGDGEVSVEECMQEGADNLMFWTGDGIIRQTQLSADQAFVLSHSPVMQ